MESLIISPHGNVNNSKFIKKKGVAMDTEPYPVVAGLLTRKAVTW